MGIKLSPVVASFTSDISVQTDQSQRTFTDISCQTDQTQLTSVEVSCEIDESQRTVIEVSCQANQSDQSVIDILIPESQSSPAPSKVPHNLPENSLPWKLDLSRPFQERSKVSNFS